MANFIVSQTFFLKRMETVEVEWMDNLLGSWFHS